MTIVYSPFQLEGISFLRTLESSLESAYANSMRVSVGNISKETAPKKNPVTKIRGTGAATKGTLARGPMA